MFKVTLRLKFLLALALISALLTSATLLLVRQRVENRVRDEIAQDLRNSVVTFQSLQQQRESTLERSAALLATLPPLKAVMTSQDMATIQDASAMFWKLIGSQLFVLADRSGKLVALHTATPGFTAPEAQESLRRSVIRGESRDWWYGSGRLFEVFLQPIYFGSPDDNTPIGLLAVGYEIDDATAADVSRVASSQVVFLYETQPGARYRLGRPARCVGAKCGAAESRGRESHGSPTWVVNGSWRPQCGCHRPRRVRSFSPCSSPTMKPPLF